MTSFASPQDVRISNSQLVNKNTPTNITSDTRNPSRDVLQPLLNASSTEASFNSHAHYPPPPCNENTRTALLEDTLATHTPVMRVTLNEELRDAKGDIRTYLQSGFDKISSRMDVPQPWPSDHVVDMLTQKAGGDFIYASTVLKYIDDEDYSPTTLLEQVLRLPPGTKPFAELDQLYHQILMACPLQQHQTLLHIFGFIILRNPAFEEAHDVSLIEAILDLSLNEMTGTLRRMHSILNITTTGSKSTITFLHASFGDFIFNEERSGQFFIDHERENLFLATRCIEYMDRYKTSWLSSNLMSDKAIVYAWNSWLYHGKKCSNSYFVGLVTKLRHCDKTLWTKVLLAADNDSYADGLDAAIAWLQTHTTESLVKVVVPDLRFVMEELGWKLCESVIANQNPPLTVLRVFENPGVGFFALDSNHVVVLERLGEPLTALYLQYRGKVYDLMERDVYLPAEIYDPPPHDRWALQEGIIALHCIRTLKSTNIRSTIGHRYAAKYWAKHVSLADTTDDSILKELQWIRLRDTSPERRASCEDVLLVVQWLKNVPSSGGWQLPDLQLLWENHLLMLKGDSSLGFFFAHPSQRPLRPRIWTHGLPLVIDRETWAPGPVQWRQAPPTLQKTNLLLLQNNHHPKLGIRM